MFTEFESLDNQLVTFPWLQDVINYCGPSCSAIGKTAHTRRNSLKEISCINQYWKMSHMNGKGMQNIISIHSLSSFAVTLQDTAD